MARKSRSKQRSKGAGTRSSKAKSSGKSQGGSRSGGKSSSSGGGKSSSSKSKSSKSKSSSNKGRSGAGTGGGQKSNPTKKSPAPKKVTVKAPAPKPKVSAPAPKAKAPAPKPKPKPTPAPVAKKKEPTKAQQMAKDRIAAGKTVSDVKTANKESMKVAAKERDQKFQATKKAGKAVQTFGGTRSDDTYSAAEKKAITDAGYAVSGYAKASAKGGLGQDTVPAGSFNISEEGKALAAQQKAEAAAKKLAASQKAAREKAAAEAKAKADKEFNRLRIDNPEMAKYIQSLPEGVRQDALIGGQTRAPGAELAIGAGTLIAGKAALGSLGIGAASKGLGYKGVQAGFTGMGKTGFDAIRGGAKYIASKKPQILGQGAYSAPTFKGAMRYAGKSGSLGGAQTPGGVIKSIVPGKASRIGFIESQAKVPGATFDKGVQLANRLSAGNYGSSPLANRLRSQMVSGVAPGGGFGANLGNVAAKVAGTTAGGLNIASGGGVDSGEPSGSGTGRVIGNVAKVAARFNPLSAIDFATNDRTDLDRMGNLKIGGQEFKPSDLVKDAGMVAGKVRNNELSIGDLKSGYRDVKSIVKSKDRLKTIGDMNTEDLTRLATKGYDLARDSAMVQRLGENQGLPKDFKQQTDTLRNEIKDRLSSVKIGDRDSTYKAISDFNRDIGKDPNLSLAARLGEAFRSGEGTTMQKIAAGYQPGAAKIKGLNKAERGVIEGSLGNRIISGKQTDIAREAMSGMKAGSSLTAGNLTGIAQNVIKNTAPGADTVSAKRASQIKSLVTGGRSGRDITPGSLLRGVNPFRGSNRNVGGGTQTAPRFQSVGGGTPVGQVPQIPATGEVPQFQVPELPVQQGTDAGNLANIQNESYQNTFRNLMAINPNYMARFQMRRRKRIGARNFRDTFSRRRFATR